MNLNQIREKYQYTDKDGVTRDRTLNIPHYFKDIPKIYSPNLKNGYMEFSQEAKKLYCYFQGWENSGNFCYESQTELGKVIDLSREHTCKLIKKLTDAGLIIKESNPGYRSKVYRTFPITDAHITPPCLEDTTQQEAPEEAPAPTMTKVIEEAVIVPESAPESLDDDVIIEAVCDLLSKPESLKQSQRYDKFTAYARRVLRSDGKLLPQRIEDRLEERFEQLHPHLYSRFDTIPF